MKEKYIFGVIGLVIGVLFGYFFFAQNIDLKVSEEHSAMMEHDTSMTMTEMTEMLYGKTGDEFDKAFILGMIEHHEGAVAMAIEAQKNAKHAEIKNLADDIITAQTNEIEMMQQWQKEWGY